MNHVDQKCLTEEETRKELIKLYRKVVNKLLKKTTGELEMDVTLRIGFEERVFDITVFTKNSNNRWFSFYTFSDTNISKALANNVLAAIKKDDFNEIIKLSSHKTEEAE